ncbi:MAG: ROK family protein [Oligosphaeraceae bacterium]|nr:ROK family protein [Oligosphaeraceae bacterium]
MRNTLSVLNVLRTRDMLSRVELARELNCPGTAITRITRELIEKGILKSAGFIESNGGRPREQIKLVADWKKAIGIELAPHRITGILSDLKGHILVREEIFLSEQLGIEEFIHSMELVTRRLLDACEEEKLLGVGIATFGPFSSESRVLGNVAAYPALDYFDIRKFFEGKFALTVQVADATYARALHEIWFNHAPDRGSFLLFDVGAGIGCATVFDGQIVFGKYSNVGELGHTVYKIDGEACPCGKQGCLETLCSIRVIEQKARALKKSPKLKFAEVVKSYASGQDEFKDIVEDGARWLGLAIANQISFLIPDKVILTGEILQLGERFFKKVNQSIDEYVFPAFRKETSISKSEAWRESAALGAASLLVRKVFEDQSYSISGEHKA